MKGAGLHRRTACAKVGTVRVVRTRERTTNMIRRIDDLSISLAVALLPLSVMLGMLFR